MLALGWTVTPENEVGRDMVRGREVRVSRRCPVGYGEARSESERGPLSQSSEPDMTLNCWLHPEAGLCLTGGMSTPPVSP